MELSPQAKAPTCVTVFVCEACTSGQDGALVGQQLLDNLNERNTDPEHIIVRGIDCLAVCERPATVSFAASGKWTYVIGDVDPVRDADDVLDAARAIANAPYGVPEMADRPGFFRRGVVARTPPPGWEIPS